MKTVTVDRDQLMGILKQNREGHRETFERAIEVYRRRVEAWLIERLRQLRAGEKIRTHINLPEPEDYTGEYDTAIRMLEMSVDPQIEITLQDFNCYVMDRWAWHERFKANTTSYLAE